MVLTVDGVSYEPTPGLASIAYTATASVEVSNQVASAAVIDVPEEDIIAGKFDTADVEASWCSWRNPSYGKVIIFKGKIADLQFNETGFEANIMSFMKDLELNIGQVYTPSCRHQLFSAATPGKVGACLVNPASFTFTGSVASVQLARWKFTIAGAAAGKADGYYSNGKVTFTSGQNNGVSFVIKKQVGNVIELMLPAGRLINAGDTFSIQAGCDKTAETCKTKFSNLVNFGGFPHINTDVNFR
jgi:uncharacterized phage protein (TIGR02218 family)